VNRDTTKRGNISIYFASDKKKSNQRMFHQIKIKTVWHNSPVTTTMQHTPKRAISWKKARTDEANKSTD
jgi:hypothetical protein